MCALLYIYRLFFLKGVYVCNNCNKRSTCKRICMQLEKTYLKFGHSLKSNYFIKFVDPFTIEEIHYSNENANIYAKGLFNKIDYDFLNSKLHKLKKNFRLCLMYYYGLKDGKLYSQTKISKILHVSQNTVKYYLRKAKIDLKNLILNHVYKEII